MFPFVRGRAANVTRSFDSRNYGGAIPCSAISFCKAWKLSTPADGRCKEGGEMGVIEIALGIGIMLFMSVLSYSLCKAAGDADAETERYWREREENPDPEQS